MWELGLCRGGKICTVLTEYPTSGGGVVGAGSPFGGSKSIQKKGLADGPANKMTNFLIFR